MAVKDSTIDHSISAQELYISFAKRFGLRFEKETNKYGDKFLVVPKQEGLNFQITLGLTGLDEAHIGVDDFWSYIFPFPEKIDYLNNTLNGLYEGIVRLAEYQQFGRVTKRCLLNGEDVKIYTEIVGIKIPFLKEKITNIISNQIERQKMKLASLKDGRDGQLIIVSRDLSVATDASDIAPTLQWALDEWDVLAAQLEARYEMLNAGKTEETFTFIEADCDSPLPRAYQWLDGSAYLNHVELVRKARGAVVPESFYEDPLMYQGGSDTFIGPRDAIEAASETYGIDMEAEITVITDDVPMGVSAKDAESHIKLVMLVNDVSLRGLIPGELAKGFGFVQSKASCAFSPVAVTPDELGEAWGGNTIDLPLLVDYNDKPFGKANVKTDMTFNMAELVAHAAKTRHLCAGTIIGSGTVSNKFEGGEGKKIEDGGVGYSCIAEIRMIEKIQTGEFITPFMRFGDTVGIEMNDSDGNSIFGRIENVVEKYET